MKAIKIYNLNELRTISTQWVGRNERYWKEISEQFEIFTASISQEKVQNQEATISLEKDLQIET